MSLAETNKLLPYSLLQEELGISTVRELEDLIIEVAAREKYVNSSTLGFSGHFIWCGSGEVGPKEQSF